MRRVGDRSYELTLENDLHTAGHTQWYFFAVGGMIAGFTYDFEIVNLEKADSLYNYGMLPLIYSTQRYIKVGEGWVRGGSDVCYFKGREERPGNTGKHYYRLHFGLTPTEDGDVCFISHCYPYTHKDLHRDLVRWLDPNHRGRYCTLGRLCYSLSGIPIDLITVTDPDSTEATKTTS